jgi:hypothetical protein
MGSLLVAWVPGGRPRREEAMMTDGDQRHEPAHEDPAPGDTSTGPRPAGRDQSDSAMPSGAVVGEVGRLGADPASADPAGDSDLGAGTDEELPDPSDSATAQAPDDERGDDTPAREGERTA